MQLMALPHSYGSSSLSVIGPLHFNDQSGRLNRGGLQMDFNKFTQINRNEAKMLEYLISGLGAIKSDTIRIRGWMA